jgi:hypothetical protein
MERHDSDPSVPVQVIDLDKEYKPEKRQYLKAMAGGDRLSTTHHIRNAGNSYSACDEQVTFEEIREYMDLLFEEIEKDRRFAFTYAENYILDHGADGAMDWKNGSRRFSFPISVSDPKILLLKMDCEDRWSMFTFEVLGRSIVMSN